MRAKTELERRTRLLRDEISDADERADDAINALRETLAEQGKVLEQAVEGLDLRTRRVARRGVRWESLGLFLVAAGITLQALAVVVL